MQRLKVGLFDSGLGGLSVLKAFLIKHPNFHYIYFGDNKRAPYGDREKKEVLLFTQEILSFFEEKKPDALLVACNTIAALAKEVLVKVDYPIFTILDSGLKLLQEKKEDSCGLLATSNTVASLVFGNIPSLACPEFAPLVEQEKMGSKEAEVLIEARLRSWKKNAPKYLLLACTHYPFLMGDIQKQLKKTKLLDPAQKMAEDFPLQSALSSPGPIEFYSSGSLERLEHFSKNHLPLEGHSLVYKQKILGK